MKYLIMECHMAYAVVLDEDGRFLKAANMDYEVGQTVDTIMEIVEPGAAFSEADCQSDSFYDTVFEEAVEVQPAVRRASRLFPLVKVCSSRSRSPLPSAVWRPLFYYEPLRNSTAVHQPGSRAVCKPAGLCAFIIRHQPGWRGLDPGI